MNEYRLKDREAYYLRSTLFNRIGSNIATEIGHNTRCRICPTIRPNVGTNIAPRPRIAPNFKSVIGPNINSFGLPFVEFALSKNTVPHLILYCH